MRVLFLHDKYVEGGGAERYIDIKRNQLEKKGDKTFLFCLSESENLKMNNSKILKFKSNKLFGSYLQAFNVYFELKKYISQINPDLIYIQNNREFTYSFILACRKHKTYQVAHDYGVICPSGWCVYRDSLELCDGKMGVKCLKHNCISLPRFLSYFFKLSYLKNNKVIGKYFSPSENLKDCMESNGFENVERFRYPLKIVDNNEKIKKDKNLFIYVGGLYWHKGIYLLVDSFREVVKKNPNARLSIIGSGYEEDKIRDKIKKLKLSKNIELLGRIENSKLSKYYKKARAVIVPSILIENYPYVVMEAIHFKTFIIGSSGGGIEEQLDNDKKGILFKRNDKNDLTNKILAVLN